MPVPWLRVLDLLIGAIGLARGRGARVAAKEQKAVQREALAQNALRLERERMDVERERMEEERQRAERALKLDLLHRAADREVARLRLMAWIASGSLLGTLLFYGQVVSTLFAALRPGTRLMLIGGWILLLAALTLSLRAQARLAQSVSQISEPSGSERPSAGTAGALVSWLIALGLALVGLAAFTI